MAHHTYQQPLCSTVEDSEQQSTKWLEGWDQADPHGDLRVCPKQRKSVTQRRDPTVM